MSHCDRCERWFPHDQAYDQHRENSNNHWICDSCDIDFKNQESREQHYIFQSEEGLNSHYRQSGEHNYCAQCEEVFGDDDELWDHAEEEHNACSPCRQRFNSREQLQRHDQQCGRSFQTERDVRHHINSNVHQSRTFPCPGDGCSRTFNSASALTHHFESGTCASKMTREQLNRLVVRADRKNYITQMWATERSWNGEAYECFLCQDEFNALSGLNQHLQDNIYKCPKPDCGNEFRTLSGLCQHVESGTCGVKSFKRVRKAMNGLMKGPDNIMSV
ncbi:hypothetical protein B0F90DRAFT_1810532 [Multifurca ochricompacta]|uniref:C2H2-type domain-containing protein n=1 Tax=Multifurca ochricompacta TaxID=376703 RepID=A0AAD4M3H5_9AGAM|nr:hypothetical protein B0F90DRAFT_1810532 [Multifurca ochricompacta]